MNNLGYKPNFVFDIHSWLSKQDYDGKSSFRRIWDGRQSKTIAKSLANSVKRRRFSNSKHFCFYSTEKHFISQWYFPKAVRLKVLKWGNRKIKKSWGSWQNRKLGLLGESKSNCWSLHHVSISPGQVKKLQNFINFCLKVGHSANWKHSKFTWRLLVVLWKLQTTKLKL